MKYTLSFIFTLMIPLCYADDYMPDENHLPPDEIQNQEERIQKQEARKVKEENKEAKEKRDSLKVNDPRFDKFDEEMIKTRDGSY